MADIENINYTEYFNNTMRNLYQNLSTEMALTKSFDEIIGTNEGRVDFILALVELSVNNQISNSLFELFQLNYQFLYDYLMGNLDKSHLAVPKRIKDELDNINYVPSTDELNMLINMIKINYNTYNKIYRNNQLFIKIPDGTLHQNMVERLEIRKDNIAHLLGITSSKSALVKIFVDIDKKRHPEYYDELGNIIDKEKNGIAVRIVDFYTSSEGTNLLIKYNEEILKFLASFESRNPGSVDSSSGGVRPQYEQKFKQEFETVFGFRFPLLEYNKMFVKNVGFYNQTELSFVSEILLDYDSRKSDDARKKSFKSNKFLVHYDAREHSKQIDIYNKLTRDITEVIKLAAQLPEEQGIKVLEKLKLERHRSLLYQFRNNLSTQVLNNLNIRNTDLIEQISSLYNELREKTKGTTRFPYDTQMLGFIPVIYDHNEYGIDELVLNCGVCETNLEVSVPELIQEYYKHSRRFYIDAIRDSHGNYVRIGNIRQEEEFQYLTYQLEQSPVAFERLSELQEMKEKLNKALAMIDGMGPYTPPNKHSKK